MRKFWEALVRRGEVLREMIRQEYMPEDFELLPKKNNNKRLYENGATKYQ